MPSFSLWHGWRLASNWLGLLLIAGIFTRIAAFGSGLLLLLFGLSMALALGVKGPLDYSVFSAAAAGFLLATADTYPLSVDSIAGFSQAHAKAGIRTL